MSQPPWTDDAPMPLRCLRVFRGTAPVVALAALVAATGGCPDPEAGTADHAPSPIAPAAAPVDAGEREAPAEPAAEPDAAPAMDPEELRRLRRTGFEPASAAGRGDTPAGADADAAADPSDAEDETEGEPRPLDPAHELLGRWRVADGAPSVQMGGVRLEISHYHFTATDLTMHTNHGQNTYGYEVVSVDGARLVYALKDPDGAASYGRIAVTFEGPDRARLAHPDGYELVLER